MRRSKQQERTLVICLRRSDGSLRAALSCATNGSEQELTLDDFKGAAGPMGPAGPIGPIGPTGPKGETGLTGATGLQGQQGATGAKGDTGAQGADGTIRIFGDGSAGTRSITTSSTFQDSNPQYTNFSIEAGVTLTVPSGTIIRCTGTFTIIVSPSLSDHPRFAGSGKIPSGASSSGQEAVGGPGGPALAGGVAKSLLRLGLLGAGSGYREATDSGSEGGGSFTVICKGAIVNSGTIRADGSSAVLPYRGGGGGGFVILASMASASNPGTIRARGGDGGSLQRNDTSSTGHGPGGGGGGGIIHLIAPSIVETGTMDITGGVGSVGGGSGTITGLAYLGGGGGGGSGGAGGTGGAVNPGGIGDDSVSAAANGEAGMIVQTLADPTALF